MVGDPPGGPDRAAKVINNLKILASKSARKLFRPVTHAYYSVGSVISKAPNPTLGRFT